MFLSSGATAQCLRGSSYETVKVGGKESAKNQLPIVNRQVGAQLALGILWCLASSFEAVFFAFFDSTIPSKQALFT